MSSVSIRSHGMVIDGQPTILLCGSLFYFRINKEDWSDRMLQLKHAGYNAIDVYFPWTFHEPEEGTFDFEGHKDIRTFLTLAKEHGLYVVARPGPYICSEYDLGAMPGYLLAKEDIKLRDNDPLFLSHVQRYFDQILPILSQYQHGKDGSIITLQIENELDFYRAECKDAYGYIKALHEMTKPHGFDIPVIACAGQGDELGATGGYPGVVPTFNFYPFSNSHKFESIAFHKYQELQERSLPLFVTETNRQTSQLRRLLAAGVSLLGPYNQVGGTDFGFTNAINNWGDPLTYLTSDYDFGGLISPKGETKRGWTESILFGKFLKTYNEHLATAKIEAIPITYQAEDAYETPCTMTFQNGAQLYTLSNFTSDSTLTYNFQGESYPKQAALTLPKRINRFFLHQYPLLTHGVDAMIDFASCEINQIHRDHQTLYLICLFEGESEVSIDGTLYVVADKPLSVQKQDQTIVLYPMSAEDASRLTTIQDGYLHFTSDRKTTTTSLGLMESVQVYPDQSIPRKHVKLAPTNWLEDHHIFKGYGEYEFNNVTGEGLYIDQASDIVTIYVDGIGTNSIIAANTPIVLERELQESDIRIKTEIWGHTNFHDNRLPALQLHAKRGLHKVYYLMNKREYVKGMKLDKHSILVLDDIKKQSIQIDDKSYIIDVFHPVISLEDHTGTSLIVESDDPITGTVYDVMPIKHTRLTTFGEQELVAMATSNAASKTLKLPHQVQPGEMNHISLQIENPEQRNMYLKVDATQCHLTVLFQDVVVGRLLAIDTNRLRMTGGSPDTVYLPGKWFTQTVGTIHILLEGLGVGELRSIEQFVVDGTQWVENIKTMKEEIQK